MTDLISLKEYAELHSVTADTVRKKFLCGGFKTAKKIGRNWTIDKAEPYVDLRKKETKKEWEILKIIILFLFGLVISATANSLINIVREHLIKHRPNKYEWGMIFFDASSVLAIIILLLIFAPTLVG